MSAVPAPVRDVEDMIPADCHGMNFYDPIRRFGSC